MIGPMLRGDATAVIPDVSQQEVFDFVIDPAQYRLADTKIVRVTKLGDRPNGMVAREDGKFMGTLPGTVISESEMTRIVASTMPPRYPATSPHTSPMHTPTSPAIRSFFLMAVL